MSYWDDVFSAGGMSPDPKKVQVVLDWPTPTSATVLVSETKWT